MGHYTNIRKLYRYCHHDAGMVSPLVARSITACRAALVLIENNIFPLFPTVTWKYIEQQIFHCIFTGPDWKTTIYIFLQSSFKEWKDFQTFTFSLVDFSLSNSDLFIWIKNIAFLPFSDSKGLSVSTLLNFQSTSQTLQTFKLRPEEEKIWKKGFNQNGKSTWSWYYLDTVVFFLIRNTVFLYLTQFLILWDSLKFYQLFLTRHFQTGFQSVGGELRFENLLMLRRCYCFPLFPQFDQNSNLTLPWYAQS